jgi:hypothetical protein
MTGIDGTPLPAKRGLDVVRRATARDEARSDAVAEHRGHGLGHSPRCLAGGDHTDGDRRHDVPPETEQRDLGDTTGIHRGQRGRDD